MKDKSYEFDVDELRETLGYSMQFVGKLFCIVIDAEPFEKYNCNQIVQDILLVANSCNTKIIVVVGCFSSRSRDRKRQKNYDQIKFAFESLKQQFGRSAVSVSLSGDWRKSLSGRIGTVLKRYQVVIVPAIEEHSIADTKQILSSLGGIVGQDQIAKLIILGNHEGVLDQDGEFLHQVLSDRVQEFIDKEVVTGELAVVLQDALVAIGNNIGRVHIVKGTEDGGLLAELFTKDGIGTMIFSGQYIEARPAFPEDLDSIRSLTHCCEDTVSQFWVAAIDDYVIACLRLQCFAEEKKSIISSLAVNPDYADMGLKLLREAEKKSTENGSTVLLLALPKIIPWWIPGEFKDGNIAMLPKDGGQGEGQRPSAILFKDI
ncbi:MAG: hypothetical protein A2998_02030 [Candidatus Staskawiczbacteria bacterium RIFCSPLOWO2_01_FULL_37_25b]|uniref:N-acetyltransferase domain-containing protein n=1 Tax=Candidatus Staskawiczbacteria bacterium RIFCSPLOWO2_01_FULL_37_25b TaxID=1802213 RepID=A0A1G2IG95_9BACT|nr:MAG: hypothetical protein A2998_02030 [Candidatus Staskawiczbacteria bacterium RIFCSPLOWO2_01_FULL_37_25b]